MTGYNARAKKFPNGHVQIALFDKPIFCNTEYDDMMNEIRKEKSFNQDIQDNKTQKVKRVLSEEEQLENAIRSGKRAKKKIADYARSNEWDWFLTHTFDNESVDRYDYNACKKKMTKWLNNIRSRYAPNLKYLVVPEQHKDGAWHFHTLLANCGKITFLRATNPHNDLPLSDKKGRPLFNLTNWKYGFTTATRVTNTLGVARYILKYITKSLCENTMGKQRYFVSENLDLPEVIKLCIETFGLIDDVLILLDRLGISDYVVSNVKDISTDFLNVRYIELVSASS